MPVFDLDLLLAHRARTYGLPSGKPLATPAEALDFIDRRGFVFFWPISGVDFPSLWTAVAGDRPVASKHDDPGHVTWGWKDKALDKRAWYYAKILRRKATFISLGVAPYFYALSGNYGSPEDDHVIAYEEGRLTLAAKQIYDTLLDKGPLDTISLRKEARLSNARESVFGRAMEDLQMDFKVLPTGVAEAGAWKYAYRYDLTSRHFPELPGQARPIGEADARRKLAELALASLGAAQARDLARLFGWPPELVGRTMDRLLQAGTVIEAEHPLKPGGWLVLPELVNS
ncbi:MAG: winged helix DNA-binding domain-containing protein [Chloroflexi bacterium]|nr:winged helix DNA-binding domain-containing protein [Chloroflexota bacterium]